MHGNHVISKSCIGRSNRFIAFLAMFSLRLAIAFSSASSLAASQEVYAWGHNNVGQLGLLDRENRYVPTLVRVLNAKKFQQISMGGSELMDGHTLVLVHPGKLFVTGDNSYGQLGLGDKQDREALLPVPSVFSEEFAMVAAGDAHSVALTTDGRIFVWGSNLKGELALDTSACHMALVPREVQIIPDHERKSSGVIVGISTKGSHTVAWTSTGRLYAWGENSEGQLGLGHRDTTGEPLLIPGLQRERVKMAVCGGSHTLALMESGSVYGWGRNVEGQLGLARTLAFGDVPSPYKIPFFSRLKVKAVAAGALHSFVLMQNGTLFAFGDDSAGQLGAASAARKAREQAHMPRVVMPGTRFAQLACGGLHTVALTEGGGEVIAWGANGSGQLGLGDTVMRMAPMRVPGLRGVGGGVTAMAAGVASSMVAMANGTLFGWGKNNAGQLGKRATKLPKKRPEVVSDSNEATSVRQLAAGGYAFEYEGHTLALTASGEVFAWGWNAFGQLGLGEVRPYEPTPRRIPFLSRQPIHFIAAGQFASAAVTEAGEVLTWGLNQAGHLGRGEFAVGTVDAPQRIKLPDNVVVVAVAIGYAHMLALTSEGRVYSWGRNSYGQLGLGDHKDRSQPELVSQLSEELIVGVAAGQAHSLVVGSRGQIFSWGYNSDFELGLGDNMDRVVPQPVPLPPSVAVRSVAAGAFHSLALASDGRVFAWGLNCHGQLGQSRDNAPARVPTPVVISSGLEATGGTEASGEHVRLRATAIAAGTWHSAAITEDGAVFTWGRCQYGQVGVSCAEGEDVEYPRKVEAFGKKKALSISAGASHTVVVVK